MKITIVPHSLLVSNITLFLLLLSFLEILQGGKNPGVIAGAENLDKHFKGDAFNELRSRQRLSKRRIKGDHSTITSSSIHGRRSLHGCDVTEYWNSTLSVCTPCTRCSNEKAKTGKGWTLRGCGFDRDTECGTILDLKSLLENLRNKHSDSQIKINTNNRRRKQYGRKNRSHKSSSYEDDNVVYGYVVTPIPASRKYSNALDHRRQQGNGHRRKVSAHHKLKETVRNLSQGRDEFLKQIQEEDKIALKPHGNYDEDDNILVGQINYGKGEDADHYNNEYPFGYEDYEEYPKVNYDDVPQSKKGSSLHQEIARIKSKLDNDHFNDEDDSNNRVFENYENYDGDQINQYVSTSTKKSTLERHHHPITVNAGVSYSDYRYTQNHDATTHKTFTVWDRSPPQNKTTPQGINGHTWYADDFIDVGENDENGDATSSYGIVLKDHDLTTEMGMFGAILKQPPKFGEMTDTVLEPVDILGRWLNKNNSQS